MKVKKNDTVYIITGKDAGKTGKVLSADPDKNRVVVDGVNVQKKHYKARRQGEVSSIKQQSGPIDASNVMVVCPKCNKGVRVHYLVEGDAKHRVCAKCGANLDEAYAASRSAKAAKGDDKAKKPARKTKKADDKKAKAE